LSQGEGFLERTDGKGEIEHTSTREDNGKEGAPNYRTGGE